jgi:hypothetical protein
MKALNQQERNSAILKFSLWLFICVVIICVPIIITGFVSKEQKTIDSGEKEVLVKEASYERTYIATKIQQITDLMARKDAKQIDGDIFNAELMNILSDITKRSEADTSWRGAMYGNIVNISKFLITANKIVSSSGDNKAKQSEDLDKIITELESCSADVSDLNNQKKKKDLAKGVDETDKQLKKIIKLMDNYKAGLK